MSRQSGQELKKLDAVSLRELDDDAMEQKYQQAVKWRYRLRTNVLSLAEQSKDTLLYHYDNLIAYSTATRGQYLTMKAKEDYRAEQKMRAKLRRSARERAKLRGTA